MEEYPVDTGPVFSLKPPAAYWLFFLYLLGINVRITI